MGMDINGVIRNDQCASLRINGVCMLWGGVSENLGIIGKYLQALGGDNW